jgi:pimeloyl-ACP methyl ester carboxylesterase
MSEVGEISAVEQHPLDEPQKNQVITVRGRNTDILTDDPKKGAVYEGLLQRPYEFTINNPSKKTGILVLPAFGGHTQGIPLDFDSYSEKYDATIVTTQHPTWTFSPEFAIAQFEDLIEEQGFDDVVFIGPSLGGTLGIELLRDYKKKNDFPFEVKALVTIGSPTCRADLKPSFRARLKAAEALRPAIVHGLKLRRLPSEVTGFDATGAVQSDEEFHGQIARASALLQKPRRKEEYPDIPVLSLTLPPGKDQIVKDRARHRIEELFPRSVFDTFNARKHSQEEYINNADEIGGKVEKYLDEILLPTDK